jgi:alcohol dehydrogenase
LSVDVAIEAVGVPETFTMATLIVRPGGNVANIGVHGKSVDLALNELWIENTTSATSSGTQPSTTRSRYSSTRSGVGATELFGGG